jgi:hypothetical protein
MTLLSPLDALGPAFRRTREVLAAPFRLGFFLKIALVAALTQPSFYSACISYPVQGLQFAVLSRAGRQSGFAATVHGSQFLGGTGLAAFGIVALVTIIVVGLALWILCSYLYCRLRFTLFDLVVYNRGRVGSAWSAYGRQSWRYFGLVILVSLSFLIVAAMVVGPAVVNFVHAAGPLSGAGANMNPFALMGAMLPLLLAVFALAALWAVVDSLMQDFLLPPMAIDDAPLESVFERFFALAKTNFGQLVVYLLLRFAVGIGLTWALMLIFAAGLVVAGLAIFGIGTLLYHALWASSVGQITCVALVILTGLVVLVVYVLATVAIYGTAAVFKQSYAAYFFGGRYAALGDRLEPPPAPAMIEHLDAPPPPSSPMDLPPLSEAPPVW